MSTDRNAWLARPPRDWKKSSHHGAAEWVWERLTSLLLAGLLGWAVYSGAKLAGGGYEASRLFFKSTTHAGLAFLMVLVSSWHLYMGLKVIIDDYLRGAFRGICIFLAFAVCLLILIGAGGAFYLIYQGA